MLFYILKPFLKIVKQTVQIPLKYFQRNPPDPKEFKSDRARAQYQKYAIYIYINTKLHNIQS